MFAGVILVFLLFITFSLLLLWVSSKRRIFVELLSAIWGTILVLTVVFWITTSSKSDKILKKNDYYGQYVISRSYFPGRQSDWQYNSFQFEIKDNDSICFYVTEKQKIINIFKGIISATKPTVSERLVLHMAQHMHHILSDNPTTYRTARGFYLVFNSPKFGNVFFTKGEWQPLTK